MIWKGLTRADVERVACPSCRAGVGEQCRTASGARYSSRMGNWHTARGEAAARALDYRRGKL